MDGRTNERTDGDRWTGRPDRYNHIHIEDGWMDRVRDRWTGRPDGTDLAEDDVGGHVHGEAAEVEQHLVCGQALLDDVLAVHRHQRHREEQVEVVGLVVSPARLPHEQRVPLGKLTLEAQQ